MVETRLPIMMNKKVYLDKEECFTKFLYFIFIEIKYNYTKKYRNIVFDGSQSTLNKIKKKQI